MAYTSMTTGLASAFCWGTADYVSRSQSERVGSHRTKIYSHMVTLPVGTALSGMGGAVATSYGLAFLKEKLEPNQVLGVLLSLAGVFALLYLGG